MSNILQDKLDQIKQEKDEKLIPENIRAGVNILGIDGSYEALDTSDATATEDNILAPFTAYAKGAKVRGKIECTYDKSTEPVKYELLTKSLSFNFGMSDDAKYIADYRTINNQNSLVVYSFTEGQAIELATSTENLPGTSNPDIKFSAIKIKSSYRIFLSAGYKISIYDFNEALKTITYITQMTLSDTNRTIYQLCPAYNDEHVVVAIHTNLSSWGNQAVATLFKLADDNNSYVRLWDANIARWQAGHLGYWNTDDSAFCYGSEHSEGNDAGYVLVNEDYTMISNERICRQCAYIEPSLGRRILTKQVQVLKNGSWQNLCTLVNSPSDPSFVFADEGNLVFIGGSAGVNNIYVNYINWDTGYCESLGTIEMPTDHMYFGSNNGGQVIGMLGINKQRTLFYNRKINAVIEHYEEATDIKSVIIQGKVLTSTDTAVFPQASDVLENVPYSTPSGLSKGTMPNNGTLTYSPTNEEQIIPAGYTSGGKVSAADITDLNDYTNCLKLSNAILYNDSLFKELTYIESNGNQCINTDIKMQNTYEITIDLNVIDTNVNTTIVSASTIWNNSSYIVTIENGYAVWNYYTSAVSKTTLGQNIRHTLKIYRDQIFIDNILKVGSGTTITTLADTNATTINIFCNNQGSQKMNKARIYSFKLMNKETNKYILDCVPVMNTITNEVGLLDKINNQFYVSTLSNFIAGPELEVE